MPDNLKRLVWPIAAILALVAYNAFFTLNFFHLSMGDDGRLHGILIDILLYGSRVSLLALAMTLVIATGGVDLSVGAIMALAGATAAVLLNSGNPLGVAILAAIGIAMAAGLVNGILVAYVGVQPIIATLLLMVAGRGIAQLIAGVPIVTFSNKNLQWLANGSIASVPVSIWIVGLFFLGIWALSRKTALGLMTEALGDNPGAAHYVGIPVKVILTSVYIVSGFAASLSGLIDAAGVTAADTYNSGLNMELDAILAVVIGGTALTGGRFFLGGSILGSVLIQLLSTTLLLHDVNPNILTLPKSILVITVCLLQSPRMKRWMQSLSRPRPAPAA